VAAFDAVEKSRKDRRRIMSAQKALRLPNKKIAWMALKEVKSNSSSAMLEAINAADALRRTFLCRGAIRRRSSPMFILSIVVRCRRAAAAAGCNDGARSGLRGRQAPAADDFLFRLVVFRLVGEIRPSLLTHSCSWIPKPKRLGETNCGRTSRRSVAAFALCD
jgi:hypothetical protein